ncbi:MAG: VIT1/CCC1 transporter family protein, partial [Euryarchaeota archaeon]|nr:VIT1/CCC1 transporter family protein [Euryarchaeota archaeon]
LADYEAKHADLFQRALRTHGVAPPKPKIKTTHRLYALFARVLGVGAILPSLRRDEAEGIEMYREQVTAFEDDDCRVAVQTVLPDELVHEVQLWREIAGAEDETRKEASGRGVLRSAVLGANDGLGSILALAAGVAGAVADSGTVLIAGIAGLIAGAVSMAASNYISVKSEQESYRARVELVRVGIEVAPEIKRAQLKAVYRRKGFSQDESEMLVNRLADDEDQLMRTLLTEEHGLTEASFENPRRLAWWTGFAFVVAGAVPILPFLVAPPVPGLIAAVVLTVVALFVTGAFRTLSTLQNWWKSGLEMALIGMGSATATYFIGLLIGPALLAMA